VSFFSILIDLKRIVFYLHFINFNGLGPEKTDFFNGFEGFQMFNPNKKHIVTLTNQDQKKR
tara:strand:+ start:1226 stop:1408 length:183 start_codon:yes stop_codon:yes gene_type:complete